MSKKKKKKLLTRAELIRRRRAKSEDSLPELSDEMFKVFDGIKHSPRGYFNNSKTPEKKQKED